MKREVVDKIYNKEKVEMKLITETIENIEVLKEEKVNGKKDYKIRGVFMQSDIKNRNGRIYPVETLAKEVKRYTNEFINKKRALMNLDIQTN